MDGGAHNHSGDAMSRRARLPTSRNSHETFMDTRPARTGALRALLCYPQAVAVEPYAAIDE